GGQLPYAAQRHGNFSAEQKSQEKAHVQNDSNVGAKKSLETTEPHQQNAGQSPIANQVPANKIQAQNDKQNGGECLRVLKPMSPDQVVFGQNQRHGHRQKMSGRQRPGEVEAFQQVQNQ